MVLHDAYHIYTVDQHSLHLIKEIERLRGGDYARESAVAHATRRAKPKRSSCFISA